MNRHDRIRALLATRHDHLPQPTVRTDSNPTPEPRWVDCTRCQGRLDGCVHCSGRGVIRSDPYIAEHDQKPKLLGNTGTERKTMEPHELEATIRRLEQTAAEREGRLSELRGWEDKPRARAYRDLEIALERLESHAPGLRHVLGVTYWHGLGTPLTSQMRALERVAVEYLSQTMPATIDLPAWLIDREHRKRQATAKQLADQGWSISRISRQLNISRMAVKRRIAA